MKQRIRNRLINTPPPPMLSELTQRLKYGAGRVGRVILRVEKTRPVQPHGVWNYF